MKKIVVLYHSSCTDGFGGAYVAWKKFGNRAAYLPVEYQKDPPAGLTNKEVYIIDFSYKAQVLEKMKLKNKKVVVLDHHKSASDDIKFATEYVFDNNHSGAVVAWRYFYGEEKVPKILSFIEDNDLWKFKLKNSKEVFIALDTLPFDFKIWDKVIVNFEKNGDFRKKIIEKGKNIIFYKNLLIDRLISRASLILFEGYKILAINSPVFVSEFGNKLSSLNNPPFSLVWSVSGERVNVSLRSIGSFDVSKIALKYGGGGHKNSAGFSFYLRDGFPWKFISD
jgi:oligoribonuclease NrnB/cAMP/cGMP phosphodiesterase (DHH superfamily)